MNYTKPVLVINATQRATYECRAENKHIGGKTVESQKATVHILGEYQKKRENVINNTCYTWSKIHWNNI